MTDRRAGSVDVQVDIVFNPDRRTGWVGVNVDYVPGAGGATYTQTVTATQAQAVGMAGSASLQRMLSQPQSLRLVKAISFRRTVGQGQAVSRTAVRGIFVAATQAQSITLRKAVALIRSASQPQTIGLRGASSRALAIVQSTTARLVRQVRLTRGATQGQSVASGFGRGFQRTLTAVQGQTVKLIQGVRLMRRLTGTNRVQTVVSLRPNTARFVRATSTTRVRLLQQVRLGRALTQAQSATYGGIPVQLRVVSTVQTRSLALGRAVSLTRLIAQGQALLLKSDLALERTLTVPTRATLERAVSYVLATAATTSATLVWQDVTPRYDILVTASVSQLVSLSTADAGTSSKFFIVTTREASFTFGNRLNGGFAVARRGVRFIVEER